MSSGKPRDLPRALRQLVDNFETIPFPPEVKTAEQWAVTCETDELGTVTRNWAVQSVNEATKKMRALFPGATSVRAEKVGDLTNWQAWLTHPLGYMY